MFESARLTTHPCTNRFIFTAYQRNMLNICYTWNIRIFIINYNPLIIITGFYIHWKDFLRLAFYSECKTLFVTDNIVSGIIGIFCFYA